jgi:hypothetical protein
VERLMTLLNALDQDRRNRHWRKAAFARGGADQRGDGVRRRSRRSAATASWRRKDFDMALERLPNPKGDRVKIAMSGKFLPYKYHGASGNVPEYGFKEG